MTDPAAQDDRTGNDDLSPCLDRLRDGAWTFFQLRGEPIGLGSIDGDDIDLIGSETSVLSLVDAVLNWVREGLCHARYRRISHHKMELMLLSIDGRHRIEFDLWIDMPQIDQGRRVLRYEHLAILPHADATGIHRLPSDVEACIYVHHLVCKRKNTQGDSAQRRLQQQADACRRDGHDSLADRLLNIRQSHAVSADDERATLDHLATALSKDDQQSSSTPVSVGNQRRRGICELMGKLRRKSLAPPKQTTMLAVMGCDGAGKTTLTEVVMARMASGTITESSDGTDADEVGGTFPPVHFLKGKHLYRKSLFYKLAVILIRPILFRSRERFDESLAPAIYLRACLSLRLRLWVRKFRKEPGLTFVDRSIIDFLYVDRKTDHPKFSRFAWLSKWFGKRIPTVHCLVDFDIVMQRKDEMTEAGHAAYDGGMTQRLSRRVPTDYVAFCNNMSLDVAADAFIRILALWGIGRGREE